MKWHHGTNWKISRPERLATASGKPGGLRDYTVFLSAAKHPHAPSSHDKKNSSCHLWMALEFSESWGG
jgi:hypothetical protein